MCEKHFCFFLSYAHTFTHLRDSIEIKINKQLTLGSTLFIANIAYSAEQNTFRSKIFSFNCYFSEQYLLLYIFHQFRKIQKEKSKTKIKKGISHLMKTKQ